MSQQFFSFFKFKSKLQLRFIPMSFIHNYRLLILNLCPWVPSILASHVDNEKIWFKCACKCLSFLVIWRSLHVPLEILCFLWNALHCFLKLNIDVPLEDGDKEVEVVLFFHIIWIFLFCSSFIAPNLLVSSWTRWFPCMFWNYFWLMKLKSIGT